LIITGDNLQVIESGEMTPVDDAPPRPGVYRVEIEVQEGDETHTLETLARWDGEHWYYAMPAWSAIIRWAPLGA
jgi:hypothetical protein